MAIHSGVGGSSLVEVLDRVLDKGVVIDAWVRVSLVGIEILTIEARVVVASVETYLKYAHAIGITRNVARPHFEPPGRGERHFEEEERAPALDSRRTRPRTRPRARQTQASA